MKKSVVFSCIIAIFALGFAFGTFAAKKPGVNSSAWQGVAPAEAAANLLDFANVFADGESWETIQIGRVYYLSGDKNKGEDIMNRYTQGKVHAGDLIRIARVYAKAGEWAKAKPLFDQVIAMEPKDEDWLIEVGAYYNLNGDRAYAEQLFDRGFQLSPRATYNTIMAAGSYLGVQPRK